MELTYKYDLNLGERKFGIKGIDVDGSVQLYPYDTKGEAQANLDLREQQQNPPKGKARGFTDTQYTSTLRKLDRI